MLVSRIVLFAFVGFPTGIILPCRSRDVSPLVQVTVIRYVEVSVKQGNIPTKPCTGLHQVMHITLR